MNMLGGMFGGMPGQTESADDASLDSDLTITGVTLLLKYRELKKRHELVCGLIELVLAAGFFAAYVVNIIR